jgi:uncharacterized membrane protein
MSETAKGIVLILSLGVATYATRIAGHLVLSRFERINHRVEAALEAVPPAVLAAIVAPMALASGTAAALASAVVLIASLRLPIHIVLLIGVAAILVLRAAGV